MIVLRQSCETLTYFFAQKKEQGVDSLPLWCDGIVLTLW